MGHALEMKSVCMAAYNGEKYIGGQVRSVLLNLSVEDELLISDDGSTDGTWDLLCSFQREDGRIRLFHGPHKGVNANFGFLLSKASGDIIFLCDQDDIWDEGKAAEVEKAFRQNRCCVVVHDARVVDEDGRVLIPSFMDYRHSGPGALKNIWKNSYMGCTMALRRELLEYVLPIPEGIEMYDQWIGVLGDLHGGSCFLHEVLFSYRRHGQNVSSMEHYPLPKMLRNRIVFTWRLLQRQARGRKRL